MRKPRKTSATRSGNEVVETLAAAVRSAHVFRIAARVVFLAAPMVKVEKKTIPKAGEITIRFGDYTTTIL